MCSGLARRPSPSPSRNTAPVRVRVRDLLARGRGAPTPDSQVDGTGARSEVSMSCPGPPGTCPVGSGRQMAMGARHSYPEPGSLSVGIYVRLRTQPLSDLGTVTVPNSSPPRCAQYSAPVAGLSTQGQRSAHARQVLPRGTFDRSPIRVSSREAGLSKTSVSTIGARLMLDCDTHHAKLEKGFNLNGSSSCYGPHHRAPPVPYVRRRLPSHLYLAIIIFTNSS